MPALPHNTALFSIITSCSTKPHLLQIHAHLLRSSLFHSPKISAALISRAAHLDHFLYAHKLLLQIPKPTVFHCNAILHSISSPLHSFQFYNSVFDRFGLRPNAFSASFLINSCSSLREPFCAMQVHATVLRDGHHADPFLLTSLIKLYVSCKSTENARKLFKEMLVKDAVACNVLISCFVEGKRRKDALGFFEAMERGEFGDGARPDGVTCLLVLQVCAQLGAVEFGERVRRYAEENGYGGASNVRNSLIAMYAKCGLLDAAYEVFSNTNEKNVVGWSAMISGLAMNGYGRDAIIAFEEMLNAGVVPDEQTFTGVLSACSHSRLVDEGMMFLDMMQVRYGITPNVHHYGCMVDLLGRAGLLDQAYELIMKVKGVQIDATTWRTLLGACKIHGHVHLGERVIEHLIELKAQQAGDYVLLLNMYATVGSWDRVAEVRRLMKDKGIQTSPGCSTIELNGEVHEFVVDDNSHPRQADIYKMLQEIGSQLKISGYIADVQSELHDLNFNEKQSALSYHSEKIALAFGILSTPPGKTIRIAKNLRTCVDCHNFAKVLSSVYNRLVIIRDRNRFHHFKEGRCSCNDFW